jgi:hypothetical protein
MAGGILEMDFSVEYVGQSPQDMSERLTDVNTNASNRTKQALMETAREVKKDLEKTSPVDTGEYRDSWYVYPAKSEEVWILNEADHAEYVMLPNSQMVGSTKADLPAQGLLHNVKGVARKHSDEYRGNFIEQLQDMFSAFSV